MVPNISRIQTAPARRLAVKPQAARRQAFIAPANVQDFKTRASITPQKSASAYSLLGKIDKGLDYVVETGKKWGKKIFNFITGYKETEDGAEATVKDKKGQARKISVKKDKNGKEIIKVDGKVVAEGAVEARGIVKELLGIAKVLHDPSKVSGAYAKKLLTKYHRLSKKMNRLVKENPKSVAIADAALDSIVVSAKAEKGFRNYARINPELREPVATTLEQGHLLQADTRKSVEESEVAKGNDKLQAKIKKSKIQLQISISRTIDFIKKYAPSVDVGRLQTALVSLGITSVDSSSEKTSGGFEGVSRSRGFDPLAFTNQNDILLSILNDSIKTRERCYNRLKEALYGKSITAEAKKELEEQLRRLEEIIALLQGISLMDPETAKAALNSVMSTLISIASEIRGIVDTHNISNSSIDGILDDIDRIINQVKIDKEKLES
ncbi:MAG: hypothetical protein HQ564_06730 [Candidatus Saganbacteria bacterium]|nr:hypothetical protein [Candidatus Saganbacteria bacterium]